MANQLLCPECLKPWKDCKGKCPGQKRRKARKAKPVKASRGAPELPSWWPTGFVPCVARDPAGSIGGIFGKVFMLAPTFEGTLAVQAAPLPDGHIGVRDRVIRNMNMRLFTLITDEQSSLQSELLELKTQMLAHGATPEAVRLVGEFIPFSKKEYEEMAAKLTKKAPAKKAATKTPAKKAATPKAEGSTGRAAADFKYKTLMTAKQAAEKTREGTWTARMVEIALSHKDAESARAELAADKTYGDKRLDFGWLEKQGYIEKVG